MNIDKIMMAGMSIFIIELSMLFIIWDYSEINYLQSNEKDFSNWFTLFLELNIGLPSAILISIKISKHYFAKSREKENQLYYEKFNEEQIKKVNSQTFMFGCFNNIYGVLGGSVFEKFPDQATGESITIMTLADFIDNDIDTLTKQVKRLRCIPIKQSHDVCDRLERIISHLKNYKTGNGVQIQFDNVDFLPLSIDIHFLKKYMEIKEPNLSERHINKMRAKQLSKYVKD